MREQLLVRSVVLIDQEAVREIEADAAERIALARRLEDPNRAVLLWLICSPIRASAPGSRASAGRYSFRMIDGGTFQVGLTVMYFIVSVSSGVAWSPGLPTTILVVQIVLPSLTTFSV